MHKKVTSFAIEVHHSTSFVGVTQSSSVQTDNVNHHCQMTIKHCFDTLASFYVVCSFASRIQWRISLNF